MDRINIDGENVRAVIVPAAGGSVFSLDTLCGAEWVPILRPSPAGALLPFEMALAVLAPFSNRISGGGFWFEGRFHTVPSIPPEAGMTLHGDALTRPWTLTEKSGSALTLTMNAGHIGPYDYTAEMTFRVGKGQFRQEMTLTNTGQRLPFGGGFHPFFPRLPDTLLQFQAAGVWLADARRIPIALADIREVPEWDFCRARPLPDTLLDNAFDGWTGPAEICQPSLGMTVTVRASSNMGTAVVYAPSPLKPHFCFEPVLHPVDAVNMPGMPGLHILDTGESLAFFMEIAWSPIAV